MRRRGWVSSSTCYTSHFGSSRLCAQTRLPVPCTPSMERAVLDWEDLRIAGFKDGTDVQLSVALVATWNGQSRHLSLAIRAWRRMIPNTPIFILQVRTTKKLKKRLHLRHWQSAFLSRGAAHRRSQPSTEPEQIGLHKRRVFRPRAASTKQP